MLRTSFVAGRAGRHGARWPRPAAAQEFNWRAQDGQTINLMFNNHPWSQAMREMVADFTAKTGIRTRMEIFNEEQFRARLTTLMQGRSADVDVFMSLHAAAKAPS